MHLTARTSAIETGQAIVTSPAPALPAPSAAQTPDGAGGIFGGYAWNQPALNNVHLSLGDGLHAWVAGVRAPIREPVTLGGELEGAYGAAFSTGIVV